VYARVVDGHALYVNTTSEQKKVVIEGNRQSVLTKRVYEGVVVLEPLEADLVQ